MVSASDFFLNCGINLEIHASLMVNCISRVRVLENHKLCIFIFQKKKNNVVFHKHYNVRNGDAVNQVKQSINYLF